ncbi:MAG TPA: hypothetical protein PLR44_04525 [Thermomicrobiales bacterium]|nr:hypothetical protein [Thermomicrobiales bacterium]HRA31702.1 hypothetical protein [Thermomicrobiales bacterium]
MHVIVRFLDFLRDFIIGDAWEIAAGLAITLVALGLISHLWRGSEVLGFVLAGVVIGLTWWSLQRAASH